MMVAVGRAGGLVCEPMSAIHLHLVLPTLLRLPLFLLLLLLQPLPLPARPPPRRLLPSP